MNECVLSIRLV